MRVLFFSLGEAKILRNIGSVMKKTDKRKNIILSLFADSSYIPMKEKELAVIMQVEKEDRQDFHECLQELLAEGKAQISKRGKYSLPVMKELIGVFRATSHGYGFVTVEEIEEDFFVSERDTKGAMHGDIVRIEPVYSKSDRRSVSTHSREARVVDILEHATNIVVGTYDAAKNRYGFVIPDDQKIANDIFIPIEYSMGAADGHKVVVEITDYGTANKNPEGKIIEILGHINDPGVDVLSILRAYGVEIDFPERVMKQAEKVPTELVETDYNGREDLRDWDMVTIDGPDAKDLDDAVSLFMEDDNYILGVHIADVTHYVKEGSALDKEALKRGTSIYPTDRVIPMLPQRLCNGICSLNEGVDRLALSCIMKIDPSGKIIDHDIRMSVIKTNHRMNYSDVNEIIKGNAELTERFSDVSDMLGKMYELSVILRKLRFKRGSIDFDIPETKIVLDDKGRPLEIKPYERNEATKLIEDFMLAANETIAEHFYWQEAPFVYRTHDNPDPEKLRRLTNFIRNYGYNIKIKDEEVHPKEIQKLLEKITDTDEEALITRLTLRSMQRAKYSTSCDGHFGLADKYYCHFTSPIRRYPDLQIHRIIKDSLRGNLKESKIAHYNKILADVAIQSSARERASEEIEREVEKLKKAEYMAERIGETYSGVISSVTNWGIYVELPNTVEGLVHISKIAGDYYSYDEVNMELRGQATGKTFKLGQKVDVIVNSVDLAARTIDFIPAVY